jgi:hypothetical protein
MTFPQRVLESVTRFTTKCMIKESQWTKYAELQCDGMKWRGENVVVRNLKNGNKQMLQRLVVQCLRREKRQRGC